MTPDWSLTQMSTTVRFDMDGRHFGDLRLHHSDNRYPTGYIPIPLIILRNSDGPTLLLTGGTHGDEYEGSAALLSLAHDLDLGTFQGRLILLPALNAPAFYDAARVSPIDGGDLNGAYGGDPARGPTWAIAHFIEEVLMPVCDAVIDLHSGGKASVYKPSVLASRARDSKLFGRNLGLARAFAAPLLWVLPLDDAAPSMNGAAVRQGVPMIAAELGGGGTVTPKALAVGRRGIARVMIHLDMTEGVLDPVPPCPAIEASNDAASVYAPTAGVFEPAFEPGAVVLAGDLVGRLYPLPDIEHPPVTLRFTHPGIAIARVQRGYVERGEKLAFVGSDAGLGDLWI